MSAERKAQKEHEAWALLESWRWGEEPRCAHCGCASVGFIAPSNGVSRRTTRGVQSARRVWKCHKSGGGCGKQFSVTTGTALHGARIKLTDWLDDVGIPAAEKYFRGIPAVADENRGTGGYAANWGPFSDRRRRTPQELARERRSQKRHAQIRAQIAADFHRTRSEIAKRDDELGQLCAAQLKDEQFDHMLGRKWLLSMDESFSDSGKDRYGYIAAGARHMTQWSDPTFEAVVSRLEVDDDWEDSLFAAERDLAA